MNNNPRIWYAIDIPGTPFPREIHLADGTHLRFVPDPRTTNRALYVAEDGRINGNLAGYVMQNGELSLTTAHPDTTPNSKHGFNAKRKQRYWLLRHVFARHQHILISRAVYMAWVRPIPVGMTIDHIDGITTNNHYDNLRVLSNAENVRDGGFLAKLRNKGIRPEYYAKPYLLRYFQRMAEFKATHTETVYRSLTRVQLLEILVSDEYRPDNLSFDARMDRDMSHHQEC